ncbi:unnamed protein product [Clavelina lepadiformis]|uniref:Uncharacterized protein n=1 Tax=Clavelina lepadiformis TaxID=159417 RepID=A0ABP0GAY1_CLALP
MISAFLKFVKSSHMQQVEQLTSELRKLFQLAQNGFLKQEVLFNKSHFEKCKIGKKTRNAYLETSSELDFSVNILSGETQFYFSHMVWQEFFTAIGLLVFTKYVDFEKHYSIFDDSAWQVLIKFMCGLLSPKSFESLKSIFIDISVNEDSRNLLKKFLLSVATIQFTSEKNTDKFLRVCSWLYEAQDDDLTNEFAQALSANIDLSGPLLPGDVISLHYVLRKCKKASTLMLRLQFHGKCLPHFFKEMSKTLQVTKIVRIKVEAAPLVFNCLNGTECDFSGCQLSKAAFKALFSSIEGSIQPLKKINISNNNLGDDEASHISTCLSNIEKLRIGKCKISASGIKSISDAISKLPEPIRYLNLSGNKFGDAGVPFIMSCLDKIEKLYMTDCNITEEGVRVIIEHIKNCSNLPKVLNFNYDKMNRSKVLRCGLDLLDNGYFYNVNLTPVGWEALAASINKLPQPMKKLELRRNNLCDYGASHISTYLSKIEELDISQCNISASGIKPISDAISKLPERIRYLNLSGNKFGDAGVPFILSCLDKIEKLYMTDCNITEEGVRVIIEHIKNCSNLPEVLEFNYDKMNRSKVLRCGLDLLDNGNFRHLHLTPVGWEALAVAINKLPQAMERAYVALHKCQQRIPR